MNITMIEVPTAAMSEETRAALVEADVITGIDVQSECEFTIFGTPPLESTVTLKRPAAMRVVQIRLHGTEGELDELLTLVRRLKGLDR
ncbi:MAG: hypothetical protein AB7O59_24130 [Pirellulales bacterium]